MIQLSEVTIRMCFNEDIRIELPQQKKKNIDILRILLTENDILSLLFEEDENKIVINKILYIKDGKETDIEEAIEKFKISKNMILDLLKSEIDKDIIFNENINI